MDKKILNVVCSICGRKIVEKDYEKNNGAERIANIPGYVHRRCKGQHDVNMTQTGRVTDVFSKDRILQG